jgi:hypothetical protein
MSSKLLTSKLLWVFAGAAIAVAVVGAILTVSSNDASRATHNEQVDAHRACVLGLAVREPFAKYIDGEVKLINEAKAQHIPLGPKSLAKLNAESFTNLKALQRALDEALKQTCPPAH